MKPIRLLTPELLKPFRSACSAERLFGSRSLCAHTAGTAESFYLAGDIPAALSLSGGVLTVVSPGLPPLDPILSFILERPEIGEIDGTLAFCAALRERMGGELESSWFMRCDTPRFPAPDPSLRISSDPPPEEIFSVLQQSHPFYREHLRFAPWAEECSRWRALGLTELYGLLWEGHWVGTGRILSQDDAAGAIGAVAVIPSARGRGFGRQISAFLTRRVLELGKTPVLISGYDEVAALYRSIGYTEQGRWGELYLNRCR